MTITLDKIKDTTEGKYMVPSMAFGWNDELVGFLEQNKNTPVKLSDYLESWDAHLLTDDLKLCKNTPKGRNFIRQNLITVGGKVLGIGQTTAKAVCDATKRLNREYKTLMPGQYANFTAYKWTYLQPEYLVADQVILPDKSNVIIILQRG